MKKENFRYLLEDLYIIYNPNHFDAIDGLIDRYSGGLEVDSVRNIFIKYNHKRNELYDPSKNEDSYIIGLVREYEKGNRILQGIDFKAEILKKKLEDQQKFDEQQKQTIQVKEDNLKDISNKIQEESKSEIEKQYKELLRYLEEKNQKTEDEIKKQVDEFLEDITNKNKEFLESINENSIIRITSNYTDSGLKLPNKKMLAGMGIGTRLVVFDENNKMVGLEIKDIVIDCISDVDGKPIIEIILDK